MKSTRKFNAQLKDAFYTELIHELGYEVNFHLFGLTYVGLSTQLDIYAHMNAQKLEE